MSISLRKHKHRADSGTARRFVRFTSGSYGRPLAVGWRRFRDGWWMPLAIVSGHYLVGLP